MKTPQKTTRKSAPSSTPKPRTSRSLKTKAVAKASLVVERFRGRFDVKLDPKGRLSLPPALRISQNMVVTNQRVGERNALHVFTLSAWERLENRISRLPSLDASVQAFERFYLSGGQVVEIDNQGRMLIPSSLRRFAQIETDAVLVGLGDKFEIWSGASWENLFGEMAANFDRTQAHVASFFDSRGDSGGDSAGDET